MSFQVPSPAMLDTWRRGDAPISDADLETITTFFGSMVSGCEALGERFALATEALRREYERAVRTQHNRRRLNQEP